jgi:hypothetical protein
MNSQIDTVKLIFHTIFQEMEFALVYMDKAQARDRWRALVSAVMNLRVP